MSNYYRNTFQGGKVTLDGHEWRHNVFEGTTLVYGGGPLVMESNLLNNVKWEFTGNAARTISLLRSFIRDSDAGKKLVDEILNSEAPIVEAVPVQAHDA